MNSVIEVEGLRKVYPDGTEALKGVSFLVQQGEFFGFLGPNGAGKTTTIKILTTLLDSSGGQARVLGLDPAHQADEIRRRIGYAAQSTGVDDELTGRENLMLQGQLYHIPAAQLRERVAELLDLLDLTEDAERPAGAYSGGMRKRLDLATGLIHRPELLFLDEPTTGLDPQTRANLWDYLERLNRQEGITIFLTTHYMEEADRLCDRLAIIDHGSIVAEGAPEELKAELGGDVVSLRFRSDGGTSVILADRARQAVRELPFVQDIVETEGGLNVILRNGNSAVPVLLQTLSDAGLRVDQLSLTRPTLDDVFLKHTGRSIRREEPAPDWRSRRNPFLGVRRRIG